MTGTPTLKKAMAMKMIKPSTERIFLWNGCKLACSSGGRGWITPTAGSIGGPLALILGSYLSAISCFNFVGRAENM